MPVVPGIVLRLDPTLGGGFVPDLLLNGRFLLRRMHSSLDRRLGLRRYPQGDGKMALQPIVAAAQCPQSSP